VLDWRIEESHGPKPVTQLTAFAEAGRQGFPRITVPAQAFAVWDARFAITNRLREAVTVRPWSPDDPMPEHWTNRALKVVFASLPVAIAGERVVAAPGMPTGRRGVDIAALQGRR
jgi:hypothetical protein